MGIIKYFAKKYVLNTINGALKDIKDREQADKILKKAKDIAAFAQSVVTKLEDYEVTDEEAKAILEEAGKLF